MILLLCETESATAFLRRFVSASTQGNRERLKDAQRLPHQAELKSETRRRAIVEAQNPKWSNVRL
jgi:hypothetical protein